MHPSKPKLKSTFPDSPLSYALWDNTSLYRASVEKKELLQRLVQ